MDIKKTAEHLSKTDSVKETIFVLLQLREHVANKAMRFMILWNKKRKELKKRKLEKLWLGSAKNMGVLEELRLKYLKNAQ